MEIEKDFEHFRSFDGRIDIFFTTKIMNNKEIQKNILKVNHSKNIKDKFGSWRIQGKMREKENRKEK